MKMLTTAATIAAVLVSAGTAMAVPVPRTSATVPPASTHRGQNASNQDLRVARRHIETAIDELARDATDYGGHREAAMDDLGLARQYLDQALDFRQSHGRASGTPRPGTPRSVPSVRPVTSAPVPSTMDREQSDETSSVDNGAAGNRAEDANNMVRGQRASNESLQDVRQHVEVAIDTLERDAHDYGGFKERALDRLQAARSELAAAVAFVHRPGVRNGGSGQRVSDAMHAMKR